MGFAEQGIGFKPGPNGNALTENPLGVIIEYFDCIDGGVLYKVKVGEDVALLNTGLDQAK